MKPAIEWLNEVGKACATAMFAGEQPPGVEVERVVKAIQDDAMREGINSVISIRCLKHLNTPLHNTNEASGSECGGCIIEALAAATKRAEECESRLAEYQAHEEQTHKELGEILGTESSLLDGAQQLTRRFDELRKAVELCVKAFLTDVDEPLRRDGTVYQLDGALCGNALNAAREALARTANPSPEPKPVFLTGMTITGTGGEGKTFTTCKPSDTDLLDWLLTQWETNLSFNSEHWTVTVRGKEVGVGKTLRDALTMAKDARLGHLEEK